MQYRLGKVTVKNTIRKIKFRYNFLGFLIKFKYMSTLNLIIFRKNNIVYI